MRALPLVLLLAAAGCGRLTDLAAPRVVTAEVEAAGPLLRTLRVELEAPAAVSVRYAAAGEPALRVVSPRAAGHRVLLARLRPGRSYRWEVEGTAASGTFRTEPLPADLAAVPLRAEGETTAPLVVLHLYRPDGFKGFVAVDGAGEVVWFWRTVDLPFGMTRRANGNFVLLDKARGLVEVTPDGVVMAELAQDPGGREMHHDVVATPANTLLFLAQDERQTPSGLLKGEAIWEWTPETGETVRRWSSWDHLSPTADRGPRFGAEWMHANSLAVGPRGNVVMSVHYFDQVVSIAPGWGAFEWRLGGVNATVPLAPGEVPFSGQHTARELPDGGVIVFDNGAGRGGFSRVVELEMSGGLARARWEWRPERANFAAAVGSARRLAGGNTLVGFGTSAGLQGSTGPVEVYEVTPAGRVVWHLEAPTAWLSYRAEPLASVAGEGPAGP